jgi:hypothetical protein
LPANAWITILDLFADSSPSRKRFSRFRVVLADLLETGLHPIERGVAAAFVDQLVVRSVLHQPPAIDGDDAVAAAHGGEAVGDDEDGASLRAVESYLTLYLGLWNIAFPER